MKFLSHLSFRRLPEAAIASLVAHLLLLTLLATWLTSPQPSQKVRVQTLKLRAASEKPSTARPSSKQPCAPAIESSDAPLRKPTPAPTPSSASSSPSKRATAIKKADKGAKSEPPKKRSAQRSSYRSEPRSEAKSSVVSGGVSKQLIADALESLAQITQPVELSYEERVAQLLHLWLRLPEYGRVKVELTINSTGKVIGMRTLEAQSERNRQFVEQRLPQLTFPVDEKQSRKQAERSLTLVLSNA